MFKFVLGSLSLVFTTYIFSQNPNVILIYGDDVGFGDVGINGGKMPTPNLDQLATEGVNFTDMHSTSSTCTPSRFGMLTGQYPWRYPGTGVASPKKSLIIDTDWFTLADVFKAANYKTAVVGKWHLGIGPDGGADYTGEVKPGPMELGFDESFIIPSTGDRVPSVYVEGHGVVNADPNDPITIGGREVLNLPVTQYPVLADDPSAATVYASNAGHNNSVINGIGRIGFMAGGKQALWNDDNMADDMVKRAETFIKANTSNPFFLFFSTHDIHVPRVPHPRFRGVSAQSWRGDAMVQLDWSVGALRKILEDNNIDKNTIIIFTSDNGPVLGDGYADEASSSLNGHEPSGEYRGGKYSIWEGGSRVPGIIWWPDGMTPGTSSALISQIDFMASFASLLNVNMPTNTKFDSENHLSAFLGKRLEGRFALMEATNSDNVLGLRRGEYKLIFNKNQNTTSLYNLEDDIGERNNIYQNERDTADSLKNLFDEIVAGTYTPPVTQVVLKNNSLNELLIQKVNGQVIFKMDLESLKKALVSIYSLEGRIIQKFTIQSKDKVIWDGKDMNGNSVQSGLYVFTVEQDNNQVKSTIYYL